MDWSEEMILKLRTRWAEKKPDGKPLYSAEAIGRHLGVSKNAVVGKAHRLEDLEGRPSPIKRPPDFRIQGKPVKHIAPPSLKPLLSASPLLPLACQPDLLPKVAPRPVPLTSTPWRIEAKPVLPNQPPPRTLRPTPIPQPLPFGRVCECAYPIGEPGTKIFRFCGVKSEPGKVYCDEHWRKTHIKAGQTEDA